MSSKTALLLGVGRYKDPELQNLRTPPANVSDLASLLQAPEIGAFTDISALQDPSLLEAQESIANIFSHAGAADLILFYFSGHGIKGDNGDLYFAVGDTRRKWPGLYYTAIPGSFLKSMISDSLSKRVVVILDCCFSGAFNQGAMSGSIEKIPIRESFDYGGSGQVVLTSTDETRLAWEEDPNLPNISHSVFSHFLIQGLKDGSADKDGNGLITADELFEFACENVMRAVPKQRPQKYSFKNTQEIVLAKNPFIRSLEADLRSELSSKEPLVRSGAAHRLFEILSPADNGPALAREALDALCSLARDPDPFVRETALKLLSHPQKEVTDLSVTPDAPKPERNVESEVVSRLTVWDKVQSNTEHDFAFLWLSIPSSKPSNSADQSSAPAESLSETDALLAEMKTVLFEYGAIENLQESHGELYLFVGDDRADRTVISSFKCLDKVSSFMAQSELPATDFNFHFAADATSTLLLDPPIGILANYPLVQLTSPDFEPEPLSLRISANLYNILGTDARSIYDRRRRKTPELYCVTGDDFQPGTQLHLVFDDFRKLLRDIQAIVGRTQMGATTWESLRLSVDRMYQAGHQIIDTTLSIDSVAGRHDACEILSEVQADEEDLHQAFGSWLDGISNGNRSEKEDTTALRRFFSSNSRRLSSRIRARLNELLGTKTSPHLDIQKSEDSVALLLGDQPSIVLQHSAELESIVQSLVKGDDLERDQAIDLLLSDHREEFFSFCSQSLREQSSKELLDALWDKADTIALEDLAALHSQQEHPRVFIRLFAENRMAAPRFACLIEGIRSKTFIGFSDLKTIFSKHSIVPSHGDWIVFQRCHLVTCNDFTVKSMACSQVPTSQLWNLAINSNIGPLSLLVLLNRMYGETDRGDDLCKLFFDCTRLRILDLARSNHLRTVEIINSIVYRLFDLDFFVEDTYFDRLDEILNVHRAACKGVEKDFEHFLGYITSLETRKADLGYPTAKLPKEIERIPKGVQRRLAREGLYLEYFVLHPDSRIALETKSHINEGNVGKLLLYRGINMALLFKVARERHLFRTRQNTEVMLHHPKCPKDFARMSIGTFSFKELAKIAMNPNANRNVRDISRIAALRASSCNLRFARENLGRIPEYEVLRLSRDLSINREVRNLAKEHIQKKRSPGTARSSL